MRETKLSQQEVAEMDESQQQDLRKSGLGLMPVRDRGWAMVRNYNGGGVRLFWHVDKEKNPDARVIEPGLFFLETDDQLLVLDADELRKWLRWA